MENKTHGLNILVDPQEARRNKRDFAGKDALVEWVMGYVQEWEQHRNTNYGDMWNEYRRIYRTQWSAEDKQRQVERSMIMPIELSTEVRTAAAELSDAFFGRDVWMDADDNPGDPNNADVKEMAAKLRYDMDKNGLQSEVDQAFLYGAIYGTGIIKLTVGQKDNPQAVQIVDNFGRRVMGGVNIKKEPYCSAVAVSPREFVIDPAARCIDDAMGMAHIVTVPKHTVTEGQQAGIYRSGDVGDWDGYTTWQVNSEELTSDYQRGKTRLVEYHGLVPKALLPGSKAKDKSAAANSDISEDVEMVEAIVLIANDCFLLKAVPNPFLPVHRAFIAYQHFTVPDSFWGAGVIEAGYHPYKALQTEIRARADGLALANYPTIWRDEASLGSDQSRDDPDQHVIAPGKEYIVSGDPNRMIREFKFSGPDRGSSQAIIDYQRMIQNAAGSVGFQTALLSSKDTTVGGSSQALQSFLRRSKRTAMNIERDLMTPMIERLAWRSMQYIQDRYPPGDFSFSPKGAMGVLQRDTERATLLELLQAIPPESPAFYAVTKLIIEAGAYSQRAELMAIFDGLIASSLNPPPPPRDLGGEARLLSAQQRIKEWEDQKAIRAEEFKREDVELLIKAKQKNGQPAAESKPAGEINLNITGGKKRVVIKRTDQGLVGESEDID